MITPCSHSFCSLCIRESLSVAGGKCPVCQTTISDGQLKRNTVLAEAAEAYILARDVIAKHEQQAQRPSSSLLGKRKRSDASMRSRGSTPKAIRLNSNGQRSRMNGTGGDDQEDPIELSSSSSEANGQTMVACPVCDEIVDSEYINLHLDRDCQLGSDDMENISRKTKVPKGSSAQAKAWANVFGAGPSRTKGKNKEAENTPTKRLSKVNYDLKSVKQLKELLVEAGLSDKGDVAHWRLKYERWVNLWNAEVDAKQPRTRHVLLREMSEWEKVRLKARPPPKVDNAQSWMGEHKDQFDHLVANARSNQNPRAVSTEIQELSDITHSSSPGES
ncbi:E3 ubiquitin-protein ligase rad18 [Serendipita sp. 399]|nr:E3 ubiquitin-protein ligase rad18 [Serendipita sp. 399]